MKNIMKKSTGIFLACYTILLFYWMILGFGRVTHPEFMYNLKPFYTIRHFLQFGKINTEVWIINILGNIGVFVPFGILLPLLCGEKMIKSFIIFMSGLFFLESIQFLTRKGSFDIDDFILNSVGFLIGYGLFKMIRLGGHSRTGGTV